MHGTSRLRLSFTALLSFILTSPAAADPPASRAELAMVSASAAPDAPRVDVAQVQAGVQAQLARSQDRIQRCFERADLSEDPLRTRARRMEIHARLTRSGHPERVWVDHETGIPPEARRCLLDAVRAIHVRPAPRGDVLVRIVYQLRAS